MSVKIRIASQPGRQLINCPKCGALVRKMALGYHTCTIQVLAETAKRKAQQKERREVHIPANEWQGDYND